MSGLNNVDKLIIMVVVLVVEIVVLIFFRIFFFFGEEFCKDFMIYYNIVSVV